MSERHLTVLQVNDLHGYLEPHPEAFRGRGRFHYRTCGGLARIATIFNRVRAESPGEVLALDDGDTFHGTFVTCCSNAITAAAGTRLAFSNGWRYGAPILPGARPSPTLQEHP